VDQDHAQGADRDQRPQDAGHHDPTFAPLLRAPSTAADALGVLLIGSGAAAAVLEIGDGFGRGRGVTQAVSHGSNDLAVAARIMRLHSTVLHDYEGASGMHRVNFRLASKVMTPDVIPYDSLAAYGLTEDRLRLYADDFCQVPASPPPLSEQRRIADILDAWDRAIAQTQALIDANRKLKGELTRRLLHEGGERNGRLGDLAALNPRSPRADEDCSVSFVPMDAVSEDGRLISNVARRRGKIGSGYTGFVDNDVLVAKITPCFENGKGGHVWGLHSGVGFGSTEFHVLRPNDEGDARFIHHHIMAPAFRRNGERYMTGSEGQRRVPAEFIEDYRIPLMDAERRRNAASILDAADNEIGLLQQELGHLTDQKRGLMQKLLSGDMRLSSMEAAE